MMMMKKRAGKRIRTQKKTLDWVRWKVGWKLLVFFVFPSLKKILLLPLPRHPPSTLMLGSTENCDVGAGSQLVEVGTRTSPPKKMTRKM
jgi:hypothetical protein